MSETAPGFHHVTVMRAETVESLQPNPAGVYADVTLGGGGHAEYLLEQSSPTGRVIGVDRDPAACTAASERLASFGDRFRAIQGTMGNTSQLLQGVQVDQVDGLIADLGVSSHQLDTAERGFSLQAEGPLDMRMDPTVGEPAVDWIAATAENDLADVLYKFGEERRSRAIARRLKLRSSEGNLNTTQDLRRAVHSVMGPRSSGRDSATRTFQAIRIAINRELEELETLLASLPALLKPGGRAAIISFHSLEDRIVKHTFRDMECGAPVHRKPRIPSEEEASQNRRSRSAKLRVFERAREPELDAGGDL